MNDHIPSGLGAVDRVDSGAGSESVHQASAVPSDVVSVSEAGSARPWRQRLFAGHPQTVIESADGETIAHILWSHDGTWQADVTRIVQSVNAHDELLAALDGLLSHYVRLVDSGDAGTWDAETEPQVIAARAAISAATGGKTA